MMQTISERHIEWTSPAALWDEFNGPTTADQRRVFRTPAILRFASDSFMQDFLGLMQAQPQRLGELLAAPEKWTNPLANVTPPAPVSGLRLRLAQARNSVVRRVEARKGIVRTTAWNDGQQPLKLFHPAHQRYYLVAACLVCRTMGLPDRPLNTGAQERASFVVRRLRPRSEAAAVNPDPLQCDELALVNGEWTSVADPRNLQPGEEQNPLSPLTYAERDGRNRRLLNGFIPVGKRDALIGARQPSASSSPPPVPDTRQILLKQQVLGPWSELEDLANRAAASSQNESSSDPGDGPGNVVKQANDQIQMIAWYVLLDLSHWLETNAPAVWAALQSGGSPGTLQGKDSTLYNALGTFTSGGQSLREALSQIRAFEPALESTTQIYRHTQPAGWPTVTFCFVTATLGGAAGLTGKAMRASLEQKLVDVLGPPPPGLPVPVVAQASTIPFDSPWFTIRCVLERPSCAALSEPVVSDPTAAFQLAAFFDPDAPARPIRIGMPADTTPAGLRKFDRNTAFVLSDVLCGQVGALKSLSFGDLVRAVLPFPFHKDLSVSAGDLKPCSESGGGFGMVCSFSLPIITICALIMLMITVKLLDIVLYWMPFFQICLPLPKKEGT
ncbi:MAG TPA: hypothetical protein VGS07_11405 [Thermoanaerobaculia bacterium]|jgi:hypothetical protein|nr:hypothetical protein [Thermoanaerobaculia bacterium]